MWRLKDLLQSFQTVMNFLKFHLPVQQKQAEQVVPFFLVLLLHGHQLRMGGQRRKCVVSHLLTQSLRTNERTDQRADQRTDKASYRVECPQLKRRALFIHTFSWRIWICNQILKFFILIFFCFILALFSFSYPSPFENRAKNYDFFSFYNM